MFNPTITIGNVIEILVIAIGGLIFLWEMRSKLAILQINHSNFVAHLSRIDLEVSKINELLTVVATQKQRLDFIEDKIGNITELLLYAKKAPPSVAVAKKRSRK